MKKIPEFLRFLLAGGTAAAVNYVSRAVFGLFMNFAASIIAAYLLGMVAAYLLFQYCVFAKSSHASHLKARVPYFVLVNMAAVVQILIASLLLERYALQGINDLFLRQEIAHFIGLLIPIFSSYFGHKHLTYK